MLPRSPLAPETLPILSPLSGVKLASMAAEIKYTHRDDLLLITLAENTSLAAVVTRSKTASAPVDWCKYNSPSDNARAIIVNAGNANAFNGAAGLAAVKATAEKAAEMLGCAPEQIFLASTGVIGEPLPIAKITDNLNALHKAQSESAWEAAAGAILTTDTFPKSASRTIETPQGSITLQGFAKGSGMIAPDMATMLGFIFTDASVAPDLLQTLLRDATDNSFNSITVDSDTSTSDTVLLAATGKSGIAITEQSEHYDTFRAALTELSIELAQLIVRDGEGASKFIEITVNGAETNNAARTIALSVANSPLVKTAIAGEDANWGRIIMALGKTGEQVNRDTIQLAIGGHLIAQNGGPVEGYDESPIAAHMKGDHITIACDLGINNGSATVWTCDLTHAYIDINADYRS